MLNISRTESIRTSAQRATLAALLLCGSSASMAASFELCATTGSATMPGTNASVPVFGYATATSPGNCPASVGAPGGPVLSVTEGDTVVVTLHNSLSPTEATGLMFQGQGKVTEFPAGTFTFTAGSPGTYLYQAAPLANAEHQVAMGLYGALVVRPAGVVAPYSRTDAGVSYLAGDTVIADTAAVDSDVGAGVSGPGIPAGATVAAVTAGTSLTLSSAATADATAVSLTITATAGQASAAAGTAFQEEAVLVLSEIDPALNGSATPGTFDMRDIAPKYFLINGKAYPETAPIATAAGHSLLLRYVNAGVKHHSMGLLGLRQRFIAKDGSPLPTADVAVTAETLAPGQTGDALVSVPATLGSNSTVTQFAVYDASLNLHNSSDQGIGGMLTFVRAAAVQATVGPATSAVAVSPSPVNNLDVSLSATVTSTASTVTGAEYFIDTKGADGSGTPLAGTFGAASVSGTATVAAVDVAALASGSHTVFVHGQDATGAWGTFGTAVLVADHDGPVTTGLVLSPNPSDGTVQVKLTASASDAASGGAAVTSATYTFDGGAPQLMTVSGSGSSVSLSATIMPPIATGTHTIVITSTDVLGNVGAAASTTLTIPPSGPTTSNVSILPSSANNGSYGLSSGQPVIRIVASETSAQATVTAAEAFLNVAACPPTGTRGYPFVATDGRWGGATENVSGDIPLANIAGLSVGAHTIQVRGRDSAGIWGACVATTLTIDKTAPTLASGSVTPAAVAFGTATVTLTFSAADTGGAGIAGVQYWFDRATPPANPRTAAGTTTAQLSLAGLAGGNHTVYFRARDAANNVSTAVRNANFAIVQAVNDGRNLQANNSQTQTSDTSNNQRVLANDLPNGGNPRTAELVGAPVRTAGQGAGTLSISCPTSLGTAGTAVGGNTICTNGAYRVTLTGAGSAANNGYRNSKRGTYTFTYRMNRAGVASNVATVTIRVQ